MAEAIMRKSKIRKAIVRKLNTAKYETLDIIVDQEHEIEWPDKDIDTLMKKSAGVTKLLIKDFQQTETQVLADLNLSGANGFPGDGAPKRALSSDEKKEFDRL
jgi:hypothetical protein